MIVGSKVITISNPFRIKRTLTIKEMDACSSKQSTLVFRIIGHKFKNTRALLRFIQQQLKILLSAFTLRGCGRSAFPLFIALMSQWPVTNGPSVWSNYVEINTLGVGVGGKVGGGVLIA